MKKIGVITVFFSENIGSVLQATAFKDFLESNGYEVYFVSTYNKMSSHSPNALRKNLLKSVIKRDRGLKWVKRYRYFDRYIKDKFKIVQPEDVSQMHLDSLVIGSDTVWDISSEYFMQSQKIFWGLEWLEMPIVTYGASIANSAYSMLDQLKYPAEALKHYRSISVRDMYSYDYVKAVTGQEAMLVCDPTMLLPVQYFRSQCFEVFEKYILVYLFDDLSEEQSRELKTVASENKLKIICLDKAISGSDMCLDATIENFLSYFNAAEYVITNTFHGTVFSILFNKRFICLNYKKNKVYELLKKFELLERLCTNDFSARLKQKIDYDKVNHILNQFREQSLNYIKEVLETVIKNE